MMNCSFGTSEADGPDDCRGTSEIVGVILLFGMVLAGASVVFLAGGSLLDSVQSETQGEQVEQEFRATADQLYQAAGTGETRRIPDTDAERTINENSTTVTISRINASDEADPGDDPTYSEIQNSWQCGTAYEQSVHALEYDLEDGDKYVFEGGGEWRVSNGHPMINTPPRFDLTYDNESGTNIELVSIDPNSKISGGPLRAEPDPDDAVNESSLQDALECPSADVDNDPVGGDVMIEVDSEYIEAWDTYLRESSDIAVSNSNVHYYAPSQTGGDVVIVIEHQIVPTFEITDIDATRYVEFQGNNALEVEATVENIGNFPGKTDVDMAVAPDDNGPTRTKTTDTLDVGESETVQFVFESNDASDGLSAINGVDHSDRTSDPWQYDSFEWNVTTADGNATGEFFLTYTDSFYRIDNADHDVRSDEVVVETDFVNIGNQNGSVVPEYNLTVTNDELDEPITWESDPTNTDPIEVGRWNDSTFSFEINRSKAPYGEYEYVVEFPQTESFCDQSNAPSACKRTGTFELTNESGVGVRADELELSGSTAVNASLIGTEMTNEGGVQSGSGVQLFENFLGSGDDIPAPKEQLVFRREDGSHLGYDDVEPTLAENPAGQGDVSINVLAPPPDGDAPTYQSPPPGSTTPGGVGYDDPTPGDTGGGWFSDERWIDRVRFAGETDVQSGDDNGYGDYSSTVAALEPGETYTIEVDPHVDCFGWCSKDTQYVSVWFDFDGNGTYEADERIDLGSSTGGTLSADVTVPADAPNGTFQYRVVQREDSSPSGPSLSGNWDGEVESHGFKIGQSGESQWIDAVALESADGDTLIEHTSGDNGGYADFTDDETATVSPGESYELTVDVEGTDQHVSAWFDLDGSGTFEDDERVDLGTTDGGEVTAQVDVPGSMPQGTFAFRVISQSGETATDPLLSNHSAGGWEGEAEDYGLRQFSVRKNPTGGWVDPLGSEPQWNGNEWVWDPATIEWSDDAGYDLQLRNGGDYNVRNWQGSAASAGFEDVDQMQQRLPLTASVVASNPDTGEELQRIRFTPDGSHRNVTGSGTGPTYRDNLNTFETQYDSFEFSAEMTGTVTFEATRWECNQWAYGGVDWNDQAEDTYYTVECVDFDDDEFTRVDVSESETAGPEDGFIRTRDEGNNTVRNPDGLLATQRNFGEIFEDGTDDVTLDEQRLSLEQGQVAFMMELEMSLGTHDPGSCNVNDRPDGLLGNFGVDDTEPNSRAPSYAQAGGAYAEHTQTSTPDYSGINLAAWDIAQNYAYDGDPYEPGDDIHEGNWKYLYGDCGRIRDTRPNFNDAVGLIEVAGNRTIDPGNPFENERVDGTTREATVDSENVDAPNSGGGVDIGVDEIEIN